MINRIREIRRARGLTLADLAETCDPPTTAQTIGRLETGTRNLSLKWMERIGAALGVDPEQLVRSSDAARPQVIAELAAGAVHALSQPRETVLPHEIAAARSAAQFVVIEVQAATGEYRPADSIWLRRIAPGERAENTLNRDCLVAGGGGELAFGRLIEVRADGGVSVLPPESGQGPHSIAAPAWIAVCEMLVRRL